MSHKKAKLLHVEQNIYGLDWCRVLHYKILTNPLTFAKMLVRKNLEDISFIQVCGVCKRRVYRNLGVRVESYSARQVPKTQVSS